MIRLAIKNLRNIILNHDKKKIGRSKFLLLIVNKMNGKRLEEKKKYF